ncbi:unnamed protein product [Moneuplotes crassus]|uniref:Uncharacterized protein n=1 Tax=Euplotes crassus TaxID=5936 RepID=A0AAD1Y0D6_EUPCR|nr:unnamed protein product [Moneuplotes crassus]
MIESDTLCSTLATTDIKDPIKSNWEHPKEHCFRQLEYFDHKMSETNIRKAIRKLLITMNSYRYLNGADSPTHGMKISRLRPYLVAIFTDDHSIDELDLSLFENTKTRGEGYYSHLYRDDITMQVYVFTTCPLKCKRKCERRFKDLKNELGIEYIIVSSFQDFKTLFKQNTARRVDMKQWMADSYIKPMITPTLTLKSAFVDDFDQISDQEFCITKVNIGPKILQLLSIMNKSPKSHLNDCNEIGPDGRASDFWPIPDELMITPEVQDIQERSSIRNLYIKTQPLEILEVNFSNIEMERPVKALFESIDKEFSLNKSQLGIGYETFQITNYEFLEYIAAQNLWSEKWISSTNTKEKKPLYFEASFSGDNQYQSSALLVLSRRNIRIPDETGENAIDPRKCPRLLNMPFKAELVILPVRFKEFFVLLRVRKEIEKQTNQEFYLKPWLELLQNYIRKIPPYYNFYIRRALLNLKYKEVDDPLKKINEKFISKSLESKIEKIIQEQNSKLYDRESVYRINHKEHNDFVFGDFPDCCKNLRQFLPKIQSLSQTKMQQMKNKSNLNLANPFSFDRKNLILTVGAIVKDFQNKLCIEPNLDVNKYNISQDIMEHEKDFKKKLIAEDDHHKPIFVMGSVQYFRKYPVLKSINISDKEWKRYTDISFGNLFTTSLRAKYHSGQALMINNNLIEEDETQEVESVFVFEKLDQEMAEEKHSRPNKQEKEVPLDQKSKPSEYNTNSSKTQKLSRLLKSSNSETKSHKSPKGSKKLQKEHKNVQKNQKSLQKPCKPAKPSKINQKSLTECLLDYYKNTSLTLRIKYEVLKIAGDLKLQRKLQECSIDEYVIRDGGSLDKFLKCFPIFREIKPKFIRKEVVNRSLANLKRLC